MMIPQRAIERVLERKMARTNVLGASAVLKATSGYGILIQERSLRREISMDLSVAVLLRSREEPTFDPPVF